MAQQINEITKIPSNSEVIKILNQIIKRYNSLGDLYQYKGSVQTYDDLLAIQNPQIGDVYNVVQEDPEAGVAAGSNFAWNGTEWDNLGMGMDGLVKKINGFTPDDLGAVVFQYIKSITDNDGTLTITVRNGESESTLTIDTGKVKTVNGEEPDDQGNIQIVTNEGVWQANEEVEVGDMRYLAGRENTGYLLEYVEAGTTGQTQPVVSELTEVANYSAIDRVGKMRMIFNLAEKDVDEILACGVVYNRATYEELWNYVQLKPSLLISEAEWQAKYAQTGGKFVPFYSSGDGTTTFRTPLLSAYPCGVSSSDDIGKYASDGLPNITGDMNTYQWKDWYTGNGAFNLVKEDNAGSSPYDAGNKDLRDANLSFDASNSNAIYGNADEVRPKTMYGIWVIKAVGVIVGSIGNTDIQNLLTTISQLQEKISDYEDDMYYSSGETFELNAQGNPLVCVGHCTTSGEDLQLCIPTPKSLKNITSITCSVLSADARINGTYLGAGKSLSSGSDFVSTYGAISTCVKVTDNMVFIVIKLNSSSSINNHPVSATIYKLKLTFN